MRSEQKRIGNICVSKILRLVQKIRVAQAFTQQYISGLKELALQAWADTRAFAEFVYLNASHQGEDPDIDLKCRACQSPTLYKPFARHRHINGGRTKPLAVGCRRSCSSGHVPPLLHRFVAKLEECLSANLMALRVEAAVDGGMGGQKSLR